MIKTTNTKEQKRMKTYARIFQPQSKYCQGQQLRSSRRA